MLDRYDLIRFDPRGVEFSNPQSCGLADPSLADLFPYPDANGSIAGNVTLARATAEKCAATAGCRCSPSSGRPPPTWPTATRPTPTRPSSSRSSPTRRIVQEILTNALRHGAGGTVRLDLSQSATELILSSTNAAHDGGGSAAGANRGLNGIHDRAALFRGTVICGPAPEPGIRPSSTCTTTA